LNAIVVNDLDQTLSDEVLTQLAVEDSLQEEFEHLSLNALAGTAQGDVLQLRALVKNKVLLILIDSGSSHSFLNQSFVDLLQLQTVPSPSRAVKLANGQVLLTDKIVPALEWWCQGHTITTQMQVLDLGAYDAILGYDWLKMNSPMNCNWAEHSVEFSHQGKLIKLQGVSPQPLSLSAVSAESLVKWHQGNDVWALAALQSLGILPPLLFLLLNLLLYWRNLLMFFRNLPIYLHQELMTTQFLYFLMLFHSIPDHIDTLPCTRMRLRDKSKNC